ncbi:hypothetical protein RGU75_00035 [Glaciimonas sp. CA11.2]|uniref:hypothetical protein n=1 Tax=Glaciimonas sp. CA11.2 TaxID=3048601 RepID=UPI002AB4FF85|nr:hypothetical protein [Glaciimonas sp. CA11.2]MDY7544627.1 hypothetical protein [Glaciimonas sp. CA11.2]
MNKKGQKNMGRRLKPALNRFSSMLIEEALELSSLTIEQLDEVLDFTPGIAGSYLHQKKDRGPQAGSIQELENRVAKLVKRTAHTIVVENTYKVIFENYRFPDSIEGKPADNLNLRKYAPFCYELRYEDNWPTFNDLKHKNGNFPIFITPDRSIRSILKYGAYDELPIDFCHFSFQWGVLWDTGIPWLKRESFGISPNAHIDSFLPKLTEKRIRYKKSECFLSRTIEGRELLSELKKTTEMGCDSSKIKSIYERILTAGEIAEKSYIKLSSPTQDDESTEYVVSKQFLIR